jgi:hypothetical protein
MDGVCKHAYEVDYQTSNIDYVLEPPQSNDRANLRSIYHDPTLFLALR